MPIDWFRGGPEFQAKQITSERQLDAIRNIAGGAGAGIRALQRAVQREEALKAEEAALDEQLAEEDVEPPAEAAPAPQAPTTEALPSTAGVEAGVPPAAAAAAPVEAPSEGFSPMGAISSMGRMLVGLPREEGLVERVARMRGELAREQAERKAREAQMEAVSRVAARNPHALGALRRFVPGLEAGAGATGSVPPAKPPGSTAAYATALAWQMAEEARGPGARPTVAELEQAMDHVRQRFATPITPHTRTETGEIDPMTGEPLPPKVVQVTPGVEEPGVVPENPLEDISTYLSREYPTTRTTQTRAVRLWDPDDAEVAP